MPEVTVIVNGRRTKVDVTPNKTIIEIIQNACEKHGLNPDQHALKHNRKILDPSLTFRFSAIPLNAVLELIEATDQRTETSITLCLQLESGERIQGECEPNDTMWAAIGKIAPKPISTMSNPVAIYMRREMIGEEALRLATLKSLGLLGGRAMMRLVDRTVEELKTQANVSAPLTRPQKLEDGNIDHSMKSDHSSASDPKSKPSDKIDGEGSLADSKVERAEKMQADTFNSVPKPSAETKLNNVQSTYDSEEVTAKRTVEQMVAENSEALRYKKHSNEVEEEVASKKIRLSSEESESEAELAYGIPEKVVLLGDRSAVAYNQDSALPRDAEDLPDDFFELTLSEVKALAVEARRKIDDMENAPLITAQQRQLQHDTMVLRKLHDYKSCVIRVRFPDRTVLQGCFKPLEMVSAVQEFVREYLEKTDLEFYLYTTPPKEILKPDSRLVDVHCVPSAIIYLGLPDSISNEMEHYLRSDVVSKFSSHKAASNAAHDSWKHNKKPDKKDAKKSEMGSDKRPSTSTANADHPANDKVPKWFKGVK